MSPVRYRLALFGVLGLWLHRGADAQIQVYSVGNGGVSWVSQMEVSGGLDLGDPDVLLPIGLVSTDNIVSGLRWIDGTTNDFIGEGDAHIWDNAAIQGSDAVLVDGDPTTSTEDRFKTLGSDQTGRRFFIDLGASFPVNRIRFFPSPALSDDFPRAYELSISDGRTYTASDQPAYQVLRRVDLQRESVAETIFSEQLIRFIQLRILSPNPFEISEFEIFGEGFVPKGAYVSQLIQLPQPVNFGTLAVKATKLRRLEDGSVEPAADAEAAVVLALRNGTDDTPLIHFAIVDRETGSEVPTTEVAYNRLSEDFRGSIIDDRENWTRSNPILIDASGVIHVPLNLPGPRDYFDFSLTFLGTPSDIIRLDSLAFTYSEPLSESAVGEVALADEPFTPGEAVTVRAGEEMEFIYDVRAEFARASQPGFDGLHIRTQSEPDFLKLEMGEPLAEVIPDSVRTTSSGLTVFFPTNRVNFGNNRLVRVTFRTSILVYATDLESALTDTRGGLPQPVASGDANGDGFGSTRVFFSEAGLGRVITDLNVSPVVLTPNGDGVNDNSQVDFKVLRLVRGTDFDIEVFDLSGRSVRRLPLGLLTAGRYRREWDARDDEGELVPPGVYLLRLVGDIAFTDESLTRLVGVAY